MVQSRKLLHGRYIKTIKGPNNKSYMYEISKIIMGMDFYGNGLLMGNIGTLIVGWYGTQNFNFNCTLKKMDFSFRTFLNYG